jgi:phytanoyl-CoA hydroxylase
MWVAPGGQRAALRKVFARNLPYGDPRSDDAGTHFDVLDASPLPSPKDLVPIEAPAGTLVVLHGLLPHWSDVNRSSRSRHAFSLHCISAAAEYPSWNWLQRPTSLPLRSLRETAVAA